MARSIEAPRAPRPLAIQAGLSFVSESQNGLVHFCSYFVEFSETKHMSGDSVHLHHPLHYRAGLAWLGFRLKSLFDIASFFPITGDWLRAGEVSLRMARSFVSQRTGGRVTWGRSLYRRWPKDEVSLFKKKDTPELA